MRRSANDRAPRAPGGFARRRRRRAALGGLLAAALAGPLALAGPAPRGQASVRDGASSTPTPRTVAQLLQPGAKLTGAGEQGEGELGFSVALSADGDTALIGAPGDDQAAGAAWVFVRSGPGSGWVQQGPKLTVEPGGETGAGSGAEECSEEGGEEGGAGCGFGRSVALSADGSTALIGAPREDRYRGAAWVFVRAGATWTQQSGVLSGEEEIGDAHFGRSVALSADGATALIGGGDDDSDRGAAWVFTRAGGAWSQQGPKLTGGGEESGAGYFGVGLALSADGQSALIGAPGDQGYLGSAFTFAHTGETWARQGAKLTGGGEESGQGRFGYSAALSADGLTALVGARSDHEGSGAAWVLTRPDEAGSAWSEQGAKLTGAEQGARAELGYSVALSSDGEKALLGAPRDRSFLGAAWLFARSGSDWFQQGGRLTGAGELGAAKLGYSVALSGDGGLALAGGFRDDSKLGAAWAFDAAAPSAPVETSTGRSATTADSSSAPGAGSGANGGRPRGGVLGLGPLTTCRVTLARRGAVAVRPTGWVVLRLTRTGAGLCRGRVTLRVPRPSSRQRARLRSIGAASFAGPPIAAGAASGSADRLSRGLAGGSIHSDPAPGGPAHGDVITVGLHLNALGRRLLRAGHGRLCASLLIARSYPAPAHATSARVRLALGRK